MCFMENNEIDLLSEEAIYSGILGALSAGGIAVAGGKKFYDITNIENKKSPQPGHKKADTREGGLIDVLSSDNIISPIDGKSNPPSIGNNVFGTGIFGNQNSETAPQGKSIIESFLMWGIPKKIPYF